MLVGGHSWQVCKSAPTEQNEAICGVISRCPVVLVQGQSSDAGRFLLNADQGTSDFSKVVLFAELASLCKAFSDAELTKLSKSRVI